MNPDPASPAMHSRAARALALLLPTLLLACAGCLGPGGGHGGTPPGTGPLVTAEQVAGCDGPVGLAIRGGAWIDVYAARFAGDVLVATSFATISRGGYGDPALSPVPGPYQVFYNDKPEVGVDPATGAVYVGWMWRTNRPDAG